MDEFDAAFDALVASMAQTEARPDPREQELRTELIETLGGFGITAMMAEVLPGESEAERFIEITATPAGEVIADSETALDLTYFAAQLIFARAYNNEYVPDEETVTSLATAEAVQTVLATEELPPEVKLQLIHAAHEFVGHAPVNEALAHSGLGTVTQLATGSLLEVASHFVRLQRVERGDRLTSNIEIKRGLRPGLVALLADIVPQAHDDFEDLRYGVEILIGMQFQPSFTELATEGGMR